jgi:hypothetical protein
MVTGLNFHDTAQVYFQGSKGKDNIVNEGIHISGSFTDNLAKAPVTWPLHPVAVSNDKQLMHFLQVTTERNRVNKMLYNRSVLLKEVTITGQKTSPTQQVEDRYTSGLFKGGDALSFDLTKENITYTDIFQYLQGRVAGLTINGNTSNPSISWRGGTPALFLDEMQVDAQTLSTISVSDVALVKVFRPPFMGATGGGANGAIAVYTRKGGDNNSTTGGLSKDQKVGYTLVKEFYSPDYAISNPDHDLPDQRTTLYWNPFLRADSATGSTQFSFYNNDLTERFHIVIEGMDDMGRIGRIDTTIEKQ